MKGKNFQLTFLTALIISLSVYWDYFKFGVVHNPYGDTLVHFFPIRYLISSAISNGIFPLWDHWTMGGMSLSTGISYLTSPFSPIVLFFSIFGTYSLTTMKLEMLLIQAVCFTGMFFWIKEYANKWIAIYGALSFSLSSQILGTQNAYIALLSMSLIPSISLSIRKIFMGSILHVGLLSLVLYLVFSSGYLGLNIVFITVIFLFCLSEYLFLNQKSIPKTQILKSLSLKAGLFIISLILFFGITNFNWIESFYYTGFNYSQFRPADYDPYYGSNSLNILYTTVFPNLLSIFSDPGHSNQPQFITKDYLMPGLGITGTIYFGIVNLVLIFYAISDKKDRKLSLLLSIFIILVFLMSLNEQYLTTKILSKLYPLMNLTRWHAWFNSLTIFFAVTLSCIGFEKILRSKNYIHSYKILIFWFLGLLLFCALVILNYLPLKSILFLPQLIIISTILTTLFFLKKTLLNDTKKLHRLVAILIMVGSAEVIWQSGNYVIYRHFWDEPSVSSGLVEMYKKDAKSGFPSIENIRKPAYYSFTSENRTRYENYFLQLVNKIPSYDDSSINLMNPKIYKLIKYMSHKDFIKIMGNIFYFSDQTSNPVNLQDGSIKITKFEPNEVAVKIDNPLDNQTLVWSSPYTPFWHLTVNGIMWPTQENSYGLTKLSLNKGEYNLVFKYKPPYLIPSFLIMFISLFISIGITAKGLKLKHD